MRATAEVVGIVTSYVTARDPQVRKNAVSALSVLDTDESTQTLARMAVEDEDLAVRTHAATELVRLRDTSRAVEHLVGAVQNSESARRAYSLLGRLRYAGHPVAFRGASFLQRVRSGLTTVSLAGASTKSRLRWLALYGVLGGLIGLVLIGLGLRELAAPLSLAKDAVALFFLLGFLVTPIVAYAGSHRSNPLLLHCDRVVGLMSEVLWSSVGSAVAGAALGTMIIGMVVADNSEVGFLSLLVAFCWMLIAQAVASRLGTLAGSGIGRTGLSALVAVVVGGICAVSGLTLATDVALSAIRESGRPIVRGLWLMLLPSGVAVTLAYVWSDLSQRQSPPAVSPRTRFIVWGVVVLALGSVGWFGWFMSVRLGGGRPTLEVAFDAPPVGDKPVIELVKLSGVPTSIRVNVKERQTMTADVPTTENPDFVIQLYRAGQRGLVKDWDDPPEMTHTFEPGEYEIRVTLFEKANEDKKELTPSEVYFAAKDPKYSGRGQFSDEEERAVRGQHVKLQMGLPIDYDRRSQAFFKINLGGRETLLQVGSVVRVQRPADASQGPGWSSAMDKFGDRPMRVSKIARRPGFVVFNVAENEWVWDTRWLVSVTESQSEVR